MKHIILTCWCLFLFTVTVKGQKKWMEKLASNHADTTRSSSFLPLPALGYAQETGLEFGLAALYSFYTNKTDTLTRNSSIYGIATLTTKNQSNFNIRTDIWSTQNKYHFYSETRYKNFPFNFYGLGNGTLAANENKLNQKLVRLQAEAEKLISKHYYTGITANFESYTFADKAPGGIYSSQSFNGKDGGKVLFLGLSQILDSRNTNTYTTKGSYLKLNYSYAPNFFGGENFSGSLFKLDFRSFTTVGAKSVLGINLIYNTLQGERPVFYLLPQLGNDLVMRGYYTGRYRDQNLMAAQTEFRYRFIPRIGMAAFAGAGNVYANHELDIGKFKPSYGAGLRYFFDPEKGRTLRLDYGIGEKHPGEERQKGFYVSFGEAF